MSMCLLQSRICICLEGQFVNIMSLLHPYEWQQCAVQGWMLRQNHPTGVFWKVLLLQWSHEHLQPTGSEQLEPVGCVCRAIATAAVVAALCIHFGFCYLNCVLKHFEAWEAPHAPQTPELHRVSVKQAALLCAVAQSWRSCCCLSLLPAP